MDPMAEIADDETPADRLAVTFEMFEFGVEMMAANLRRHHPGESPEQIERHLEAWLADRPGAEQGDGAGATVALARFR